MDSIIAPKPKKSKRRLTQGNNRIPNKDENLTFLPIKQSKSIFNSTIDLLAAESSDYGSISKPTIESVQNITGYGGSQTELKLLFNACNCSNYRDNTCFDNVFDNFYFENISIDLSFDKETKDDFHSNLESESAAKELFEIINGSYSYINLERYTLNSTKCANNTNNEGVSENIKQNVPRMKSMPLNKKKKCNINNKDDNDNDNDKDYNEKFYKSS